MRMMSEKKKGDDRIERVLLELVWTKDGLEYRIDRSLKPEGMMMVHTALDLLKSRIYELLSEAETGGEDE